MKLMLIAGAATLIFASSLARASIWTVDAAGGHDFTEIADALNVAVDGDTILVKPGTYHEFTVRRAVDVIADVGGKASIIGTVRVERLREHRDVRLRGLASAVVSSVFPLSRFEGLVLASNRGAVLVEDCDFYGGIANNSHAAMIIDSYAGARVEQCDHVLFTRCSLIGGWGPHVVNTSADWRPGNGGHGLWSTSSRVAAYDSRLFGGEGGDDDAHNYDGGDGGHGALVDDGFFFASGSVLRGGDAGYGGSSVFNCGDGGNGGSGLRLAGSANAYVLDDTFEPGVRGPGGTPIAGGPSCPSGANGRDVDADPGASIHRFGGLSRSLTVESPVRETQTSIMTIEGVRGDKVALLFAFDVDFWFRRSFAGVLAPTAPYYALFLADAIPGSGILELSAPQPPLPPGVDSAHLTFQAILYEPSGGVFLSSASTLNVLRER